MAFTLVTKPKEADRVLLIDASNLIWRANHAYRELATSDGRPSGAVFGSVRLIVSTLASILEPGKWCVVMAYDGDNSKVARQAIVPGYKSNRNRDPERYNPIADAREVLKLIPGLHVEQHGYEGDDAIAWVCELTAKGMVPTPTTILSSDKDVWGLLQLPHVTVFSPNKNRRVNEEDILEEFYSKDPRKVYLSKALFGDASDVIKGVPRLMKKHVTDTLCLEQVVTPEDFYRMVAPPPFGVVPQKTMDKLKEHETTVHNNYKVVLPNVAGFSKESVKIVPKDQTVSQELRRILASYECTNLIDRIGVLFT